MSSDPIGARVAELAGRVADGDIRFATAESCTGGQLAAALAGHSALGSHLERGYVVYSVDAKCEMLGISRALAERSQGVGTSVTAALAEAALDKSRADVAIAITGFCGPQEDDEEVGLVHLACAVHGRGILSRTCHFGEIGRRAVLDVAVAEALTMLCEAVPNATVAD
ncbi:nicotinamide-nucleotide amidohydrolase family protein [Sphingopyxis sp. SE2]|jgi:nicotinamide-nucleotide amidase|uniref:CinA family protein n=1 Tax=Sphingopyxis sp. SE2 TaxID=1586240 RepID=UPI0028BFF46E|nr:nicotinamide-nucleotide amidohydrolase family protein [Sphingopyxis sp. SE2]MDT7527707.1 nicotinamide-nucleotide amidohydrolase family protein [Sphingopyxis sp. SE2]